MNKPLTLTPEYLLGTRSICKLSNAQTIGWLRSGLSVDSLIWVKGAVVIARLIDDMWIMFVILSRNQTMLYFAATRLCFYILQQPDSVSTGRWTAVHVRKQLFRRSRLVRSRLNWILLYYLRQSRFYGVNFVTQSFVCVLKQQLDFVLRVGNVVFRPMEQSAGHEFW